ncbi:hypothetical protein M011DRAFT_524671 [Sporormia fimetaria CBS 119925]|uniref:Uncharacterized protein n=1 Tax=Sporormia fimetaria CBS 119925 TaxID=1340428 RepID=A0A6A6VIE9_9PLEO|nr:hypothetical protein M011DRAFT_524671 [Sporormia fimetaria CBS 119925]
MAENPRPDANTKGVVTDTHVLARVLKATEEDMKRIVEEGGGEEAQKRLENHVQLRQEVEALIQRVSESEKKRSGLTMAQRARPGDPGHAEGSERTNDDANEWGGKDDGKNPTVEGKAEGEAPGGT